MPDSVSGEDSFFNSAAEITELRLKLLAAGYDPVPAIGKRALLKDWQKIEIIPEVIHGWEADARLTNTGIRCGGAVGVDIDILDPALSERVKNLALQILGDTNLVRIGRAPKQLLVYRTESPMRKKIWSAGPEKDSNKIEVLGAGSQFIAFGTHPDTLEPYAWPELSPLDVPLCDLPAVTDDMIEQFLEEAAVIIGCIPHPAPEPPQPKPYTNGHADHAPQTDVQDALDALNSLPPDLDYDNWIKVGFALHGALGPAGAPHWAAWSAKSAKNVPTTTSKKWPSFAQHREINPATLFYLARQHGFRPEGDRTGGSHLFDERPGARTAGVRPVIDVSGADEPRELEAALTLLDRIEPKMFWRGEGAVHVSRQVPIQIIDPASGERRIERVRGVSRLTAEALAPMFARVAQFTKPRNRRVTTVHAPPRLMAAVLADGRLPGMLPMLAGIASAPIMNMQTGEARSAPGYDPMSCFWIDGAVAIDIPETPTKADALTALGVLRELLTGFPFVAPIDEVVAVALLLTAAARPSFDKVPGALVLAPDAGAGKSYLSKVIGALMTGVVPTLTGWPERSEEFIKHLDALLLKGVSCIIYDNVNDAVIGNDRLNSVLTEQSVSVRPLGRSEDVSVPTTGVLIIVNGNNSEPHADATQRFLATNIDTRLENGRERTFSTDPLAMVLTKRGRYIGAALTILRAYIKAGRPEAKGYGSFDLWSRTVRSALLWLGLQDPHASIAAGVAADPEREKRACVLSALREKFGIKLFTVADIMREIAAGSGANGDVLTAAGIDAAPSDARKPATQWGYYLKRAHHKVAALPGGEKVRLHLDPVRGSHSTKRWVVEIVSPPRTP